jgi:hypothetical protein
MEEAAEEIGPESAPAEAAAELTRGLRGAGATLAPECPNPSPKESRLLLRRGGVWRGFAVKGGGRN